MNKYALSATLKTIINLENTYIWNSEQPTSFRAYENIKKEENESVMK